MFNFKDDINIIESDDEVIKIFKKYNVSPYKTDNLDNTSLIINNNPDVIHALIRAGFSDSLTINNHPKYSHILHKDDKTIYVNKHINAHGYFL